MSFFGQDHVRQSSNNGGVVRRIVGFCVLLTVLATIYATGNEHLNLESLSQREDNLRQWIGRYPVRSFVYCFLAYIVVSLVPGTTGKSLVVAWFFGFWRALFIVNVGLTLAAITSLMLSRHYFHEIVSQRWHKIVTTADSALERDGGLYVLLLRLVHFPFTVMNYALGATSIQVKTFWWTTQVGILPGNLVFVYAGTTLPSLKELATDGVHAFLTPRLTLAFVLLTVVPVIARWTVHMVSGRQRGSD